MSQKGEIEMLVCFSDKLAKFASQKIEISAIFPKSSLSTPIRVIFLKLARIELSFHKFCISSLIDPF